MNEALSRIWSTNKGYAHPSFIDSFILIHCRIGDFLLMVMVQAPRSFIYQMSPTAFRRVISSISNPPSVRYVYVFLRSRYSVARLSALRFETPDTYANKFFACQSPQFNMRSSSYPSTASTIRYTSDEQDHLSGARWKRLHASRMVRELSASVLVSERGIRERG